MARENNITMEDITLIFHLENSTVDKCRQYVKKFPDAIRHQNQRGENALHTAARNPNLSDQVKMLIEEGFDVNAKNYWGQTPLHYAAQARSIDAIHHILSEKNTDVSCKDANEYTALHFSAISTKTIDNEWEQCLNIFIKAGIDINSQTKYGQSILQLVSKLPGDLGFLIYVFQTYPDVNIFSTDLEGKNILHFLFNSSEAKPFHIIEEFDKWIDRDKVTTLLNQPDCSGSSPWLEMMTNCISTRVSSEDKEKLAGTRGVNLNTSNNMGNTALHLLAESGSDAPCKSIETLLRLGINANLKNVFGQTAVSLSLYEETLDVFINCEFDWDTCDRWKRTPFHEIITQDTRPQLLIKMHEKHPQYLEKQDVYDSTPLHFAAYNGNKITARFLLKWTKNKFPEDKLGDKPYETALHHGKLDCYQYILKETLDYVDKEKKYLLYKAPSYENLSQLSGKGDIRKLLKDFPKDMEAYSENLLRLKHIQNIQSVEKTEEDLIITEVKKLVDLICNYVSSYDPRFKMSVFQTGSTAEGTKVGQPDEFDFALCVETLSEECEAFIPPNAVQYPFVYLKFKENMAPDYTSFSDENRYFVALPFLHYLFRYIRRALQEKDLWLNGDLFIRPSGSIHVLRGKPVFNFNIYWNGSKYKQLKISIDLVPVVHIAGWWPSFISVDKRNLMTKDVQEAGCFIMLYTKANKFNDTWSKLNNNIEETCEQNQESTGNEMESNDHLLLRVSIAPAEIALMKSLPEQFKKAYALAKIIKRTEICPRVNLDECPSFFDQESTDGFEPHIVNPSEEIKSYWLKNCTFYVAEACNEKTPLEITKLIYEKLLEFATSCQLKAYLFPQSDILKQEKDEAKAKNDLQQFLLTRKVCIDTVLGILGHPFPVDNDEWIKECELKYRQFTITDEEMAARYSINC